MYHDSRFTMHRDPSAVHVHNHCDRVDRVDEWRGACPSILLRIFTQVPHGGRAADARAAAFVELSTLCSAGARGPCYPNQIVAQTKMIRTYILRARRKPIRCRPPRPLYLPPTPRPRPSHHSFSSSFVAIQACVTSVRI